MSWKERIQVAKYTSPSGSEFEFLYENVSVEVDKKTSTFIFPEIDGAYIQDLGIAGRRFPFVVFFSGEDYDLISDSFMLALEEKGVATLEHPKYGTRKVIPTGTITRRDDLISESNQAAFNITFSETLEDITFPASTQNAENNITNSADAFSDQSANEFSDNILTENNGDKINLQTMMSQQLNTIGNSMDLIVNYSEEKTASYNQMATSYENNIDDLFDDVEGIARQGISIIRLPSQIQTKAKSKVKMYSDMFTELVEDYGRATESLKNVFFETNKNLMSTVAFANESMLYSDFSSRTEAIETSEDLLDFYDDLKDWQDSEIEDLDIVDTGAGYDTLAKLVGQVAGYLIALSFELPKEKRIILGQQRNIIELVSELYGDLDMLDTFIIQNNLTCDDIELLDIGREVVYYE